MLNYLVLVDAAVTSDRVQAELKQLNTKAATFHLVVPARPLLDGERDFVDMEMSGNEIDESPEELMARWRLRDAITALDRADFQRVSGEVGPSSALDAITALVEQGKFHAVVVITPPLGPSSWVKLDLASRVERHIDEPVVHIEVAPAPSEVVS